MKTLRNDFFATEAELVVDLPEWSCDSVLKGGNFPTSLDLKRLQFSSNGPKGAVSIAEILEILVPSYSRKADRRNVVYPVGPNDAINQCHGADSVYQLLNKWRLHELPDLFLDKVAGINLNGLGDVLRAKRGGRLFVPAITFHLNKRIEPFVRWRPISFKWDASEAYLHESQ